MCLLWGEFGLLNCDDICTCVVNKQFEQLEFVFDFVYADLKYNEILLLRLLSLCCMCIHVVLFGLSVRLSCYVDAVGAVTLMYVLLCYICVYAERV